MTDWYAEISGGRGAKLSSEMEHRFPGGSRLPAAPTYNVAGGLKAGLADDLQTRIRVYARSRFPDEPEPEKRYGVINGEIVYRADNGQIYREGAGIQGLPESVSRAALPTIGGTVGLLAGGGSPVNAGLGAAAGEAVRKNLAGWVLGEPQTMGDWTGDVAVEGALGYGGAKLGKLIADWRNAARARDITPAAEQEAARMRGLAGQYLGDERWLTPGEAGDIASLQRQQTMLGMSADVPGDVMRRYNQERAAAVAQGVDRFVGSPQGSAVTGRQVAETANETIGKAVEARTKAVTPSYTAARKSGAAVPGTQALVDDIDRELATAKGPVAATLRKVRGWLYMPKPGAPGERVLDDSVDGLHQAKIAMDALLEKQGDLSVDKATRRLVADYKTRLVDLLAQASPEYEAGRSTYQAMSPAIEEMRKSIIGLLAETNERGWKRVASTVFNPGTASPGDVATVRRMVQAKNPTLWDEFVRGYWRQTWESVPDKTLSAGARWRDKMFGTPNARRVWEAALGKDDFRAFSDFMDVLEASGRVAKGQSITHFAGEEARRQELRAAPILSAARDVGRLDPLKLLIARARDRLDESVARLITSPDAMRDLRQLRALPKGSERALEITGMALLRSGAVVAGEAVEPPPPDQMPTLPGSQ